MERIGEYQIKRLVGEGGMGKVYEAEERLSKRRVALKILRAELTKHEDGRRLFLNEMQILARLEHQNLVRSLASMEHEGQLVMVLEYLEGRTLREEISEHGTLPWTRAVDIAAQIASALDVAHSQEPSIVHRDLKPENVMLLEGGGVKVMDFGVAKVLEGASGPSTQSIGTLQYMSPEQIDAGAIDGRSDLYSLGLVLYEMLTGEPPFRSSSPRELLNLQCTAEPPELEVDVPQGIEDLLLSLLSKSANERPATATDVVTALAPFRVSTNRRTTSKPGRPKAPAVVKEDTAQGHTPSGTLHSRPAPKTDTVALIEKGTAPREISTRWAVAAILVLSVIAGVTTYGIRSRSLGSDSKSAGYGAPSAWVSPTPR